MSTAKAASYDVLNAFFDEGSFQETDEYLKSADGAAEAVTGFGTVDGVPVFAFAQNVDVCGGAMSKAQAKKIIRLYNAALKCGAPVVGFYDSVGGRLEQKYELLSAYGDILRKSSKLSGVVPQISVVLGSCLGTSAMIAASADYIIMEQDARLGIDTAGTGASAQENLSSGTAAFVCESADACVDQAKKLLSYFPANNLDPAPAFETVPAYEAPDRLPKYFADRDSMICTGGGAEDFCTAFGRVNGYPVGVVVTRGTAVTAFAAAKIAQHVRFCDAFSIPVITIVDADRFISLSDASLLASVYADATVSKIAVISGKAVGAVYIALAGSASGSDFVYALPQAVISPVAPKAAAFIMDASIADAPVSEQDALAEAYVKENLTARKAAEDGYVDDIVEPSQLRDKLSAALDMLATKRVATLPKKHSAKI